MGQSYDLGAPTVITLTAAEDLSDHQYRALVISGQDADRFTHVMKPLTAGAMVYGVQRNAPLYSRGDPAVEVVIDKPTIAKGNGTVVANCRVGALANGLFRLAQSGDWVRGIALTGDGGVSGGRFTLDLHHMGQEP